jgi:hypothetical protein
MIITLPLPKAKNLLKRMVPFISRNTKYIYVLNHKGEEVISERHQKDFKKEYDFDKTEDDEIPSTASFTNIEFDDI